LNHIVHLAFCRSTKKEKMNTRLNPSFNGYSFSPNKKERNDEHKQRNNKGEKKWLI